MSLAFRASFFFPVAFCVLAVAAASAEEAKKPADPAKPKINYAEHIQPIFREHCYTCHSADTAKAGLAIDSYGATMLGGAGGEVVFPGDLESSRLWMLVSHKETPKMPPEQDRLADAKLDLIKQWILDGALENSGSKAKPKPKNNLEMKVVSGSSKPEGPPPMPSGLPREPYVYTPRAGALTALAASPWAPLAAVAGQKQILLYHTDTGELLGILPFPEGEVHVLKFSRSGTVLLAGGGHGGQTGRVVLFDVKTGARLAEVGDELDTVLAADVNDDLTLVALGGPRRIVRVYSVADGTVEYELRKHTDWVYSLEFSPDGVLLATSDRSGGLFIWEADSGREFQNLTGHTAAVTDVSWRVDSNILASCSEDGTIKLWEMDNGKQVKSWSHGGPVTALEFARDGRLVSAGRDNRVKLWDGNGKELRAFDAFADNALEVAISHDNAKVIAGDWTGEIRLWNAADGKLVAKLLENPPTLAMLIDSESARAVQLDGQIKQLEAELAAAKAALEAKGKAAQAAAAQMQVSAQELARLQAAKAAAEKSQPQLSAAEAAAREAAKADRGLADAARKVESDAKRPVEATTQAWRAADKKLTNIKDEKVKADLQAATLAKQMTEKRAALAAAEKKPDAGQIKLLGKQIAALEKSVGQQQAAVAAIGEKLKQAQATLDKAAADKAAAEKVLGEKSTLAKAAADKANASQAKQAQTEKDRKASQQSLTDMAATIKKLTAAAPPEKAAAEKAAGEQAAAEKALAERQVALKTAVDGAAAAKASAERAKSEKAALDKTRTAQAQAGS